MNLAKKMALFHDLAEYSVPDYVPSDRVDTHIKFEQEKQAIAKIKWNHTTAKMSLLSLWYEYEIGLTVAGALVRDLDKIDAAIQAMVYSIEGYNVEEFFPYTEKKIKDPELLRIYRNLLSRFRFGTLTDPYHEYYNLLATGLEK